MKRQKQVSKQAIGHIQQWIKDYKWKGATPDPSKGDSIARWSLHAENNTLTIKRFVKYKNGQTTWQRLKREFYEDLLTKEKELENLIIFLNGEDPNEVRALRKFKIKNAYLPRTLVQKFYQETLDNYNNTKKKDIETRLEAFNKYGIEWLTNKDPNPLKWKKFEKEWGKCLLNMVDTIKQQDRIFPLGELKSKNTLVRVVWLVNHFLEFLYNENPLKYPLIVLTPITKADFARLEQIRKSRDLVKIRSHINPDHWKIIQKKIKDDPDLCVIELCYEFGLRRNEALALNKESLYSDNILIDKQVNGDTDRQLTKLPKNYAKRRIPYNLSKLWIKTIADIVDKNSKSITSPRIINLKWRKLMKSLGYKYDIHDCRHSFTRRMLIEEQHSVKAVMEFCGHQSIMTTNKYLQSKTEYSNEKLDLANIV